MNVRGGQSRFNGIVRTRRIARTISSSRRGDGGGGDSRTLIIAGVLANG